MEETYNMSYRSGPDYKPDYKPVPSRKALPLSPNNDTWILIPGFLGYDEIAVTIPIINKRYVLSQYYGSVQTSKMLKKHYVTNPSNVSSMHDRAQEVFAEVMGGVVDYGEEHAHHEHHVRYGKRFEKGLYPEWSEDNPVILLGHSYGAPTARYLHYCLSNGRYKDRQGRTSNASWVKGIVCLSGVNRGATLPYIVGLEPGKKSTVRTYSLGRIMLSIVLLYEWLDFEWLNKIYGFQLNKKFHLSRRQAKTRADAFVLFINALRGKSPWSDNVDNCMYDLSVQAALEWNKLCVCKPGVYYLNYISCDTWRSAVTGNYWPNHMFTSLFITTIQIGSRLFSSWVEREILGEPSNHFWQSDGAVSVVSQHPCPNQEVAMRLVLGDEMEDPIQHTDLLKQGIWHNIIVPDTDHMGLIGPKKKPFFSPITTRFISEVYRFNVQFLELVFLFIIHCVWGKKATYANPTGSPPANVDTDAEASESDSDGEGGDGDGTHIPHAKTVPAQDVFGEHIRKEIVAPLAAEVDMREMTDPSKNEYGETTIVVRRTRQTKSCGEKRRGRKERKDDTEATIPLSERKSDRFAVEYLDDVRKKSPGLYKKNGTNGEGEYSPSLVKKYGTKSEGETSISRSISYNGFPEIK